MDNKAIVKASSVEAMLNSIELDPRLLMAAKAIQLMQGTDKDGKQNISAEMALAAAIYQAGTGQLVGRDFYVNDKVGRMEGYRGAARDASDRGAGELQIEYRKLTPGEAEENEMQAGDVGYACEVWQLRAWRIAQRLAHEQHTPCLYKPIIGIGIVREVEKFTNTDDWKEGFRANGTSYKFKSGRLPRDKWKPIELEGGMTWAKKAKNRAYKDALRHVPGVAATQDEVIEEGALHGAPMPPEGAKMTMDQAIEWVRQNAPDDATEGEIVSETEIKARAAANVTTMRGPKTDDPFGIDAPAPATSNGHTSPAESDAEFDAMPSASEQRQATAPAEKPAGGQASLVGAVIAPFWKWAESFVKVFPYYAGQDGKADKAHILQAVKAEGYPVINGDNLNAVCKALEARAERKQAA